MARRKGAGRNAAKSAGKGIVNHAAGGMAGSAVKKASGGASRNRANSPAKNTAADAASMKANEHAYEIGELDHYLFGQGNHYEIYKKLGAHKVVNDKTEGVYFAVWAPNAKNVSVVGEFNDWNLERDRMERQEPLGIYVKFVPEAKEGQLYKFCIETQKGELLYKADPFANYAELRPGTASRITDLSRIRWTDDAWMKARKTWNHKKNPMSIYEVHMGSWMRHPGREDEGFYTYREFAEAIVKYVKEMGYTHVELMGIAEHPFDGSWGYQVTGYYAPTSRYGSPEDFAYLVDLLHKNNIGVILDWVPAHFPKDAHGLADFDGTPTFEYADPRLGEHPDWGTKVFDYGKAEVRNFLIANALFWIEHFHVDGLRVDAVASMLYLDYGKQDGQWVANKYGGNENLEAIDFFKHLNSVVLGRNKGAVMIAEESTAWPKVTGSPEDDGLGFSLKWNMGWMHDFTEYMKLDPYFRKNAHHMMTFAMQYAYSENYILVLSHDEVVHLKCSMINKMPGLGFDKFANLKAGYAFMMGHPGKKLLFMGQEFAQLREWSEKREIDWFLLAEPEHRDIQNWYRDLLHLYKNNKALYEMDNDPAGFEWINADDIFRSIYSFVRHSKNKEKNLLFVCNFTPVEREDYRVGVPTRKTLKLV
ncbi:MAG: 1,4-alpha-glucan branching protein GlgB, partial [[Ruminococcus] torques]|nr:1,4-alpha-glucan branching protein GlgB [[Ruminococcus] torques]